MKRHEVIFLMFILAVDAKGVRIPTYNPSMLYGPSAKVPYGVIEELPYEMPNLPFPGSMSLNDDRYSRLPNFPLDDLKKPFYYPLPSGKPMQPNYGNHKPHVPSDNELFDDPNFQKLLIGFRKFPENEIFEDPDFQRILNSYLDTSEQGVFQDPSFQYLPSNTGSPTPDMMHSPELQSLLSSYQQLQDHYEGPKRPPRHPKQDRFRMGNEAIKDTMKEPETEHAEESSKGIFVKKTSGDNPPALPMEGLMGQIGQRRTLSVPVEKAEEKADEKAEEEVDDYYDEKPMEDSDSNRRTFGLLVPFAEMAMKGISGDLGLGSADVQGQDITRSRQRQATIDSFKLAQEQATIEALKSQANLESLKTEALHESLKKKAEIDSLKTELDRYKEQKEQESREKDRIKMQFEFETTLRQKEQEELKRRLDMEMTLREKEKRELEWKLRNDREEVRRDQERFEKEKNSEVERIKSSYISKQVYDNQQVINDYRYPYVAPGAAQYVVPPLTGTGTGTVGVVAG